MRKFREAVLHVLNDASPIDPARLILIGRPKRGFVDPIGLAQDALGKAESLEHFHRATGHSIGLSQLQRPGFLLDDSRPD